MCPQDCFFFFFFSNICISYKLQTNMCIIYHLRVRSFILFKKWKSITKISKLRQGYQTFSISSLEYQIRLDYFIFSSHKVHTCSNDNKNENEYTYKYIKFSDGSGYIQVLINYSRRGLVYTHTQKIVNYLINKKRKTFIKKIH